MDQNSIITDMLQMFTSLVGDEQDSVRLLAVDAFVSMAAVLKQDLSKILGRFFNYF